MPTRLALLTLATPCALVVSEPAGLPLRVKLTVFPLRGEPPAAKTALKFAVPAKGPLAGSTARLVDTPVTVSVPVVVTDPPPVACKVNVYVPAITEDVVVSVKVVAVVGHLGGLEILFDEKLALTPLGNPEITENEIVLLLPV